MVLLGRPGVELSLPMLETAQELVLTPGKDA